MGGVSQGGVAIAVSMGTPGSNAGSTARSDVPVRGHADQRHARDPQADLGGVQLQAPAKRFSDTGEENRNGETLRRKPCRHVTRQEEEHVGGIDK